MRVTIITVCYNSERTIEKTIQSVINQTYQNIEYIIIDGKSTDQTVTIIKSYNKFISKWFSEIDCGLYDAINKGIIHSTGNLIGILHSDDIFFSNNVIEEIVKFHSNNLIQASIGDILQVNRKGRIVRKYSSQNWDPAKLKFGFMPPHPSIFIKKELYLKYGFYLTDFKISADFEFVTRLFLKNKITWDYSNITTTKMLIGGLSSSGIGSYITVTREIAKSLKINRVKFMHIYIYFRFIGKFIDIIGK
jgi:glycosyltransferase involved in cell wall biosynthesis